MDADPVILPIPIELLVELLRAFSLSVLADDREKISSKIVQLLSDGKKCNRSKIFSFMILMKKKKFDDPNMTIFRCRNYQTTHIFSSFPSAL